MFKRIVVGYAGDRAGRDGVLLASRLAALSAAEVTIVYPYHPLLASVSSEVAEERTCSELQAMLGEEHPLPASARLHWSNASWPIRALHELAVHEGAGLIVFGGAPERLERRHLSLMERMVHGAPCAVAVAPAGYADSPGSQLDRFGVGFADTPEGQAAVTVASELAAGTDGELALIGACGLGPVLGPYAALGAALPEVEQEMLEETRGAMELAAQRIEAAGRPRPRLEVQSSGDPCKVLCSASADLDLLVLGSRAYGPLRCALLGGVSAGVMRGARCPVLVLPRGTPVASGESAEAVAAAEG